MRDYYRAFMFVVLFVLVSRCAQAEDLSARLAALQAQPRPSEAGRLPTITVVPGLDQPPAVVPIQPQPGDLDDALERQRRFDAEDAADAERAARAEAEDTFGKLTVGPGSELSRFDQYGVRRTHRRRRH